MGREGERERGEVRWSERKRGTREREMVCEGVERWGKVKDVEREQEMLGLILRIRERV